MIYNNTYELAEQYQRIIDNMTRIKVAPNHIPPGYLQQAIRTPNIKSNTTVSQPSAVIYSLCTVQLVGGDVVALNITASPRLSTHLIREMKETGFLNVFNDTESLCIRADRIVAISLQQLTTEE